MEGTIRIATINTFGQLKLTNAKQSQIEDFLKAYNIDIAMLQETESDENSFKNHFIDANFNVICNNASTGFGTAVLIKNDISFNNIRMDTEGKTILFDANDVTFGNIYLQSGTDAISRQNREHYISYVLPNLLMNCKNINLVGADWNSITHKSDATAYADSKL